jgi:hypothetical protein
MWIGPDSFPGGSRAGVIHRWVYLLLRFLLEPLTNQTATSFQPAPRRTSVPISRTIRACKFHSKGYGTYLMGSTALIDDREVTRYSEKSPRPYPYFLELLD